MPWDRSKYPADWEAIRERILARAGNKCEWPGCGVRNETVICRMRDGEPARYKDGSIKTYEWWEHGAKVEGHRFVQVILTTAHTCSCDPICGDESHLLSLCQMHHLRLDVQLHRRSAARTRRRRDADRGQGFLITDIDS